MRITLRHYGIPFQKHYFATPTPHVSWREILLPTAYMDCYSDQKPWLFSVENRYTLLTDLTMDEEAIFQNFPKDTRNQIRRCERERHFTLNLHTRLEQFIPLYNDFAKERGLSLFSRQDAECIGRENYCIFSIDDAGTPLICHLYLLSPTTGTINLLISASSTAYCHDQEMRRIMGHANRCLHWQGIRHFKAAGFHTYDWGGYAVDTVNPTLQGINRFKRTFNGKLTPIYNYYSPVYGFIERLRKKLRESTVSHD